MKPRSTMSEEPAMSVSAAATMPPVHDSAVASLRLLARHATSTWPAFAVNIASDNARPHQNEKRRPGIDRREHIIEHDPEPAMQRAIGPARRPRLGDVGDAEQHEADGIGEQID